MSPMAIVILSVCFVLLESGICGAHGIKRSMNTLMEIFLCHIYSHTLLSTCTVFTTSEICFGMEFVITSWLPTIWAVLDSAVFSLCHDPVGVL